MLKDLNLIQPKKTHDFIVCGADTDSIMFCKRDQAPFSDDEQDYLLDELNSFFPELIKWEHDGIYKKVIYVKAKNYILYDGKKMKYKGSSLQATTLEPKLKAFMQECINVIINDNVNLPKLKEIYNRYAKEACNVDDIKPWCARKTISEKTMTSDRTNESIIRDAIQGKEIVEGDRIWVYYTNRGIVKMAEEFDGDYSISRLLHKLHNTAKRFQTILPVNDIFPNYSLTRSKKLLTEVLGYEVRINKV